MRATAWMSGLVAVALAVMSASGCASLPRPPWASAGTSAEELEKQRATRAAMQKAIRAHMGTRYRLGGTTRKGIDCSGFTSVVYKAAGVTLPRTAHDQYREGRSVTNQELQFGDLLFFNTKKFATSPMACFHVMFCPRIESPLIYGVTHTGVYVGDGRFVHASTSHGVSYARMEEEYWKDRYIGARRILDDWHPDVLAEPAALEPAPRDGKPARAAPRKSPAPRKKPAPPKVSPPPAAPSPPPSGAAEPGDGPDQEPPPAEPPPEMAEEPVPPAASAR